ncbi:MAG: hypothetical protein CK424_02765 [Legionella sp.]|nr:MAG: hypothetical protein CK424_02765 [Legionella sp.]
MQNKIGSKEDLLDQAENVNTAAEAAEAVEATEPTEVSEVTAAPSYYARAKNFATAASAPASRFANSNRGYALLAVTAVVSTAYLTALALNPTLIPYGLAALSGWHKTAAAVAASVVALTSAYLISPASFNALKGLLNNVAASPKIQLALAGLLSAALIALVYTNPAFLAFAGLSTLSTTAKVAATTTAVAAINAYPAFSLFKARAAAPAAPGAGAVVDAANVVDADEQTTNTMSA